MYSMRGDLVVYFSSTTPLHFTYISFSFNSDVVRLPSITDIYSFSIIELSIFGPFVDPSLVSGDGKRTFTLETF